MLHGPVRRATLARPPPRTLVHTCNVLPVPLARLLTADGICGRVNVYKSTSSYAMRPLQARLRNPRGHSLRCHAPMPAIASPLASASVRQDHTGGTARIQASWQGALPAWAETRTHAAPVAGPSPASSTRPDQREGPPRTNKTISHRCSRSA